MCVCVCVCNLYAVEIKIADFTTAHVMVLILMLLLSPSAQKNVNKANNHLFVLHFSHGSSYVSMFFLTVIAGMCCHGTISSVYVAMKQRLELRRRRGSSEWI